MEQLLIYCVFFFVIFVALKKSSAVLAILLNIMCSSSQQGGHVARHIIIYNVFQAKNTPSVIRIRIVSILTVCTCRARLFFMTWEHPSGFKRNKLRMKWPHQTVKHHPAPV